MIDNVKNRPPEFEITTLPATTLCDFCRRAETDRWLRGDFMGVTLCDNCLEALKAALKREESAWPI